MLKRILYSLRMGWHYRRQLAAIYTIPQIDSLRPQEVDQSGNGILVLDFDGVLAPHGEDQPGPQATNLLDKYMSLFGVERLFILSNKPTAQRLAYFAQHYPGLRVISGVRKKPYPDGLHEIMRLSAQQGKTVTLVDDRLLTGALAACIAGTQVIYIGKPFTNLAGHPFKEGFFMLLRLAEKSFFRLFR